MTKITGGALLITIMIITRTEIIFLYYNNVDKRVQMSKKMPFGSDCLSTMKRIINNPTEAIIVFETY